MCCGRTGIWRSVVGVVSFFPFLRERCGRRGLGLLWSSLPKRPAPQWKEIGSKNERKYEREWVLLRNQENNSHDTHRQKLQRDFCSFRFHSFFRLLPPRLASIEISNANKKGKGIIHVIAPNTEK